MNYLWEVLIHAAEQGILEENITFRAAKRFSAYLEVAAPLLNQEELPMSPVIEVNPYYRFYDIFKDLFHPELRELETLRESLANLILHQLAQNDALSGMTREEYYKKLLYQDFANRLFGDEAKRAIGLFNREEREVILSGLLRQYETGSSMDLFQDMMRELIPDNIVYRSNDNFHEIFVYIGQRQEKIIEEKMDFLIWLFVELPDHVEIYYQHHFGIMGIDETMVIDEMVLC